MGAPDGGTYARRCAVCNGEPHWTMTRRGDAVVSWACDVDLTIELRRMQRPQDDPTEIVISPSIEVRIETDLRHMLDERLWSEGPDA